MKIEEINSSKLFLERNIFNVSTVFITDLSGT